MILDMNGQITIYTITGCPHCLLAKKTLREKELKYTEVSLDKCNSSVRDWLQNKLGKSSVPQIFFNDTHIGGNENLQSAVKDEIKWLELCSLLNSKFEPESLMIPSSSEFSDVCLENTIQSYIQGTIDPQTNIVDELMNSGVPHSIRPSWLSQKYDNAFSGQSFILWYCNTKDASLEEGVKEGSELLKKKYILPINSKVSLNVIENDAKTFYRLNESADDVALNAGISRHYKVTSASELAETLRKLILQLFSDYISNDGKYVDYEEMKNSNSYVEYVKMAKELQRVSVESLSENEKKAFFINIYNALVIHATTLHGPPKGWLSRLRFFGTMKYIIGGHPYSLNDIENGVLRANKKGVLNVFSPFGKSDPRKVNSLAKVDPRIHFALNCGAKSCPPIKTFTSEDIDKELDLATAAFLENDDGAEVVFCDAGTVNIRLSSLIKWYSSDFGESNVEVIQWVIDHLGHEEKKAKLKEAFEKGSWKISYIPYDWGTNSKE